MMMTKTGIRMGLRKSLKLTGTVQSQNSLLRSNSILSRSVKTHSHTLLDNFLHIVLGPGLEHGGFFVICPISGVSNDGREYVR